MIKYFYGFARALSIVLVDFEGTQIGDLETPLSQPMFHSNELAQELRQALSRAARDAGAAFEDLSAIGLGLAGMVDVDRFEVMS